MFEMKPDISVIIENGLIPKNLFLHEIQQANLDGIAGKKISKVNIVYTKCADESDKELYDEFLGDIMVIYDYEKPPEQSQFDNTLTQNMDIALNE